MIRTIIVSIVLAYTQIALANDDNAIYGIYTNMEAKNGEVSGFEMYFLNNGNPGRCDDSVLFQTAEGWPQPPELLACCKCSTDDIQFTSAKWGTFKGAIRDDVLIGEFEDSKLKVNLPKGLGFWQKR